MEGRKFLQGSAFKKAHRSGARGAESDDCESPASPGATFTQPGTQTTRGTIAPGVPSARNPLASLAQVRLGLFQVGVAV